jgi:acyl-coenzyme A synthetase/AMP-(fatty) acid ligase
VIEFVRTRLARFKAPKAVHFVEALPRSAMGKVSKDELLLRTEQVKT